MLSSSVQYIVVVSNVILLGCRKKMCVAGDLKQYGQLYSEALASHP